MATKKTRVTYSGMNQDVSKTKYKPDLYYDANNIKLTAVEGQTLGTASNAYGNKLVATLPSPTIDVSKRTITAGEQVIIYNNDEVDNMPSQSGIQNIIGHTYTRDGFLLFSTDDNGFDCIWEVSEEVLEATSQLEVVSLYARSLQFSTDNLIDAVFNYENTNIQKVYWVDGTNYLRYLNKEQEDLIDMPSSSVNSRSAFTVTQPEVVSVGGGGVHTAGVIQYAFTLYNLTGSETTISPLSQLYPLGKGVGLGGGDVNEVVGAMPVVEILDLDSKYEFIKLYSVKYTEYNGLPSVNLVYDGGIGNHAKFTYNDTGSNLLGSLGTAEFLFLGADAVKPKHIETKHNILFIANNTTTAYKLDVDTRAYSYKVGTAEAIIYNDVVYDKDLGEIPYTGESKDVGVVYDAIPIDFDSVNLDFDTYRYLPNSTTEEGDVLLTDAPSTASNSFIASEAVFESQLDTDYPVAIWEMYNEGIVSNNVITPNYNGNLRLNISVTTNMNGILPVYSDLFSIGLYKNGSLVSSALLALGSTGILNRNYQFNIDVSDTDVLEYRLVTNDSYLNVNVPGDWNISITATTDIVTIQSSGSSNEGGAGKHVQYELTRSPEGVVDPLVDMVFKDNEIYRIGILFKNTLGQNTEAKWIADFKAPIGNLTNNFNTLKVSLTDAFYAYVAGLPEDNRPTSFQVLRAVRGTADKTIVAQGLITPMLVQTPSDKPEDYISAPDQLRENDNLLKVPTPFTRGYGFGQSLNNSYYPIKNTRHLATNVITQGNTFLEIYVTNEDDRQLQSAWQYTKMFQMQSAEATFQLPINTSNTDKLVVLGHLRRDVFQVYEQTTNVETGARTQKYLYGAIDGEQYSFYEDMKERFGLIGPSYRAGNSSGEYEDESKQSRQTGTRKTFYPLNYKVNSYNILGAPEVSELGQGPRLYKNDSRLRYSNSLITLTSDEADIEIHGLGNDSYEPHVVAVDSEGSRCITLVAVDNADNVLDNTEDAIPVEEMFENTNAGGSWDSELFGEIHKSNEFIYSGSLYGGYRYYNRNNTEYRAIGPSTSIDDISVDINSPGDTFVQVFKNTRFTRTPGSVYDKQHPIIVETLEYPVETTVNLSQRNDLSIQTWGGIVDPYSEEANKYNRVYSTELPLVTYSSDSLKIQEVTQAETEVMASKVKIPGEFIESWVDFRVNEVQYLDGKYGPINSLTSHWDEIYAFQDTAVARLSINPRAQVQAQDGIDIELGTAGVLDRYIYLTTKTGSINKWGIRPTNSGIYFTDAISKQFFRVTNKGVEGVSDQKGLHGYMYKHIHKQELSTDNPLTGNGVLCDVDMTNGDIYTTVKDSEHGNFTVVFNEKMNVFTSFYSFIPTRYLMKGDKMFSIPEKANEIWKHYDGDYQTYYGEKYEADITLLITTDDIHAEKIFNNIEFDSEVSLDGVDVANSTITSIEAWDDYQKTGKVQLVVGESVKRRMGTWKANIPRQEDSRVRMRDKWIFLKLGFNPEDNQKLILHDVVASHTEIL